MIEPFMKRPGLYVLFVGAFLLSFLSILAQRSTYTAFGGIFLRPYMVDMWALLTSPFLLVSLFLYAVASCGLAGLIRAMRTQTPFKLKTVWVGQFFLVEVAYIVIEIVLYMLLYKWSPTLYSLTVFLLTVPLFFFPIALVFEDNWKMAIKKSLRALLFLPVQFLILVVVAVVVLGLAELLNVWMMPAGILFLGFVGLPILLSLQSHLYLRMYPIIPSL